MAVVVSVALFVSGPIRRAVASSSSARAQDRNNWYRRVLFSMQRPKPLGTHAPTGQDAREMPYDVQGHPGYGVTIERVVSVFGQAEAGWPREQCDLFDDLVEGDCHVRSQFLQRAHAVAGRPYIVKAGGDSTDEDQLAARALAKALSKLPLMQFFEHQLSANKYGYAASEIDWGTMEFEGRTWVVPVWLANVPARRFKIDITTNTLRLLTQGNTHQGEALRPGKWFVTQLPGPIARAGLMRSATFPICYKRFGTRDWVIAANRFGMPLVVVKYTDAAPVSDSTDDPSRQVGLEIIRNLGGDGGCVVPNNIEIDVKETARSADGSRVHGGLIVYCNSENSKLITGSTLANDNAQSGQGSYAQASVHDAVRWDLVQYDAALLEEAFRTQLGEYFVVYNGLAAAAPLLRMQIARDLAPLVRAEVTDIYVNKLGGKASRTQLAEDLGYREPFDAGDELPGAPVTKPAPAPAPGDKTEKKPDIAPAKKAA